jgi:photosystem II stability/assembly factor-like uncharacterized protein
VAVTGNLFKPTKDRGIYRSRDGGRTWELVHFVSDRTGAVDLTMDPKNPNTLIGALWTVQRRPWTIDSGSIEGGMVRTTDGGTTWTKVRTGLPPARIGRVGVSISGANSQRVYAQVEAEDNLGGVYRSDDGGTSWTRTFAGRNLQQRAWYYTHIHADPVDVDTVYGLNVGSVKSTDGGKTFQNANIGTHSDYHDLWINPTNNKAFISGNDGGANVSLDGGTRLSTLDNQPTSEIYRLEVDTRFPYWVYGGQQDNSTIAVPSQGTAETYAVGGGESGHVAVDPRDFNVVYAGNYGGTLSRMDRKFNLSESIRVYSDMQTGQRAADMKYRFQWNAPIKISPHTPDVVYTTSQHVHRTRNSGLDWETISPDLTRNNKGRQQYSGGEGITRDNTGVEVYGTVFVLEESRTTPGLLWAGSDDGLVHVSRDNGKSWQNVTPATWPEGCINSIEPSVHDPARATVAMYRYRQGDFTPYLYQTNDYGRTWRRIADGTNGIPNWHFTRVVREDTTKKGLLFAGTEFGFYVSTNDGTTWQNLQLGLPRTPVTDMKVYRDDLIVTTQGRGFYVLDNMGPLRTVPLATAQTASASPAAILYQPEEAYRAGGNPPTFHYWFRETPTAPVTVEVTNAQGRVMLTTTAQPGTAPPPIAAPGAGGGRGGRGGGGGGGGGGRGGGAGGPGGGGYASAVQGMNRAAWTNLQLPPLYTQPPGIVMWGGGGGAGPKVQLGTYTVKVSSGAWSQTQTFHLGGDPRYMPLMTDAESAEQFRLTNEVGGLIKNLYDDLAQIRDARKQAAAISEKSPANSPVRAAAKTLTDALVGVESELTQIQGEGGGQDALNFPGRMDNQLIALYGAVASPDRRLGTPVSERYKDLKPEADRLLARSKAVLSKDIVTFNTVATKAGLEPIVLK